MTDEPTKNIQRQTFYRVCFFFEKKFEKYLVVSEKVRTFAPANQK